MYSMKKYHIILLLITAWTLTACSSGSEEREGNTMSELITFGNPTLHQASSATRGSIFTDITDLQKSGTDIRVTAKYKNDHGKVYIDNERLQYVDGAWTINKYFWLPDTHLDFFAEVVAGNGDMNNFTKSNTTNYTFDYTVPADIAKQYDYIYAVSLNKYREEIPLNFTHALSQIVFTASVAENWNVEIKSITIHNVSSTGTFSYETGQWTAQSTASNSYKFELATVKTFNGISSAAPLQAANDDRLLLMPQTLNPWVPKVGNDRKPITSADSEHKSYVEIECKIKHPSETNYYAGTATSYGKIYAPIAGTWLPGKKYIYELPFGYGYTADGKPTIEQITLSPTIVDWETGETVPDGTVKFD